MWVKVSPKGKGGQGGWVSQRRPATRAGLRWNIGEPDDVGNYTWQAARPGDRLPLAPEPVLLK